MCAASRLSSSWNSRHQPSPAPEGCEASHLPCRCRSRTVTSEASMPYPPNVRADGCRGTAAGHRLTDLRQFSDTRGSLAVIELGTEVGFPVRRVYYMYGAGAGSARGAHAHRELHQLIVAMQGSFQIS